MEKEDVELVPKCHKFHFQMVQWRGHLVAKFSEEAIFRKVH
jgi:hypothetical protein